MDSKSTVPSMSAPNNEGQPTPGEVKQEETRESDNMEVAAKGSEDMVRLVNDVFYSGESNTKVFNSQNPMEKDSDDAEKSSDDMEKSVSEKSKATGDEENTPKRAKTLQDYQLDHSNMGPNSPTGKRARSRTSDVWSSILRLKGELAKS
jgi:hypothetical protein